MEEMEIVIRNNYKRKRNTKLLKEKFFGPLSQAPKPEKEDRKKEKEKKEERKREESKKSNLFKNSLSIQTVFFLNKYFSVSRSLIRD